jgi:hypothetical protein
MGFRDKFRIEFDELITPDGLIYNLHDGKTRFLMSSISGQGLPPIEYITQSGPFQNGETVKGYRLRPRVIQMIHRRTGDDRFDYWDLRTDLLNTLRPNRTSGFTHSVLRKYLPDGSIRDLDVRIDAGPEFGAGNPDQWDEFSFTEGLRFIASDPTFYDPTSVVNTTTTITETESLNYPTDYPVIYGPGTNLFTSFSITYDGTWDAFPILTITGPVSSPRFENTTTGEVIELDYNIPAGRIVTVDLRYGQKRFWMIKPLQPT